MAKVNLLPWRSERRKVRQKEFFLLLGISAAVAFALGVAGSVYFSYQIDGQTNRNAYLNDQISQLEAKLTEIKDLQSRKAKLMRRKDAIEELQTDRSRMVHLFDELVRTIPEGVRLTSIKQNGDKLTLDGQTQSNARVSAYMRNIEASGWMTNPDLSVIEVKGDDKTLPYTFDLTLTLTKPGQVLGPDGKPVLGPDGKPLIAPMAAPAASTTSPAPTSPGGSAPASAAPAPATVPAKTEPTPAPAAGSKGGATP